VRSASASARDSGMHRLPHARCLACAVYLPVCPSCETNLTPHYSHAGTAVAWTGHSGEWPAAYGLGAAAGLRRLWSGLILRERASEPGPPCVAKGGFSPSARPLALPVGSSQRRPSARRALACPTRSGRRVAASQWRKQRAEPSKLAHLGEIGVSCKMRQELAPVRHARYACACACVDGMWHASGDGE
jgi:hypothetical protein